MNARQKKLRQLAEDGVKAYMDGKPCEAPTLTESERAAWEIGWRAEKSDSQRRARNLRRGISAGAEMVAGIYYSVATGEVLGERLIYEDLPVGFEVVIKRRHEKTRRLVFRYYRKIHFSADGPWKKYREEPLSKNS